MDYDYAKKVYNYKEIPWNSAQDYFVYDNCNNNNMGKSPEKNNNQSTLNER